MSFDGKLAFQHSLAARQIVFNWNHFYLKKKTTNYIKLIKTEIIKENMQF